MTPLPPPQGMSEADYETIEAAVTETVRGRWFLGEFARRNRAAELRQILDAVARLEGAVASGQQAVAPPADPTVRLLMQRIKEIAGQLETLAGDMQDAGIDPRFVEGVGHQAHAVAGMMRMPGRGVAPPRPGPTVAEAQASLPKASSPETPSPVPRMPRAELPPVLSRSPALESKEAVRPPGSIKADQTKLDAAKLDSAKPNPSLVALSALDTLALAKKLALFS